MYLSAKASNSLGSVSASLMGIEWTIEWWGWWCRGLWGDIIPLWVYRLRMYRPVCQTVDNHRGDWII